MVVDDEAAVRRMLRRALERGSDFLVTEASDGLSALEAIEKEPPSALILDLSMPGMSGTELLDRLSRLSPRPKVVVLSGHVAASDISPLRGADALLPKTTPARILIDTLNRVLAA